MKFEIMNENHRDKVLELSKAFYCSDALDHEVPMNIIETNIDAAISGDKGLIVQTISLLRLLFCLIR